MIKSDLTVGQVSTRSGVNISTIHFYESKGLISSYRTLGNQRRYNRDVLRRIAVIKAAKNVGLSLEQICESLKNLPNNRTPNVKDWQILSSSWEKELNNKIWQLEQLRDSLTHCIGCGCLSLKKCPLYNKDDKFADYNCGSELHFKSLESK